MSELIIPTRRGFLLGAGASLLAAPAVIRVAKLMAIRAQPIAEKLVRAYDFVDVQVTINGFKLVKGDFVVAGDIKAGQTIGVVYDGAANVWRAIDGPFQAKVLSIRPDGFLEFDNVDKVQT